MFSCLKRSITGCIPDWLISSLYQFLSANVIAFPFHFTIVFLAIICMRQFNYTVVVWKCVFACAHTCPCICVCLWTLLDFLRFLPVSLVHSFCTICYKDKWDISEHCFLDILSPEIWWDFKVNLKWLQLLKHKSDLKENF